MHDAPTGGGAVYAPAPGRGTLGPEAVLAACPLPARGPLLVAVSGGSDSMALAVAGARVLPGRVEVVHVRHGLRPDDGRDGEVVAGVCDALSLPFRALDASPGAARPGRSETAARERRLDVLARAARGRGAVAVLLAHHREDALETVLLHLRRGHRGDRALAGIPALRALASGPRLVRPFVTGALPIGRAELANYRRAQGIPCVEDPTNADTSIPRNAIRRILAEDPALVAAVDGLRRRALARLRRRVREALDALAGALAPEGAGSRLARAPLAALDRPGLVEVLRLLGGCLAVPTRLDPRAPVVERLATATGGRLLLPGSPRPIELRVAAEAFHLPHDRPAAGGGMRAALGALLETSLYL